MKLKQLFTDDDAVSPVIGVILMVAITVILAAVIASFVLGLGQSAGDNSPSASFDVTYDAGATGGTAGSEGLVTVTHNSGDTISDRELYIKGKHIVSGDTGTWRSVAGRTGSGSSDVTSGDSVDVGVDDRAWELRVVWQPPEKDTSSTLTEETGPDA